MNADTSKCDVAATTAAPATKPGRVWLRLGGIITADKILGIPFYYRYFPKTYHKYNWHGLVWLFLIQFVFYSVLLVIYDSFASDPLDIINTKEKLKKRVDSFRLKADSLRHKISSFIMRIIRLIIGDNLIRIMTNGLKRATNRILLLCGKLCLFRLVQMLHLPAIFKFFVKLSFLVLKFLVMAWQLPPFLVAVIIRPIGKHGSVKKEFAVLILCCFYLTLLWSGLSKLIFNRLFELLGI